MSMFAATFPALPLLAAGATLAWLISIARRDVSIVDSFWPLFLLAAAVAYAANAAPVAAPGVIALALVAAWAVRLCAYLTWRNWGEPEDRRYQAIRTRHSPGFEWKSLFLVFLLQALLAWVVSWPLSIAMQSDLEMNAWRIAGAMLAALGIAYETIADWQLARFRRNRPGPDVVLDSGLWRYSRHPNYFGEFLVWWGLWMIGNTWSGWWAVISPLLMTVLLLRISGVALLERDLVQRRGAYAHYVTTTSAFVPGIPRRGGGQ